MYRQILHPLKVLSTFGIGIMYIMHKVSSHQAFVILPYLYFSEGTAVAQWLRCCATNWKVAGSIPDGVIGSFH